jgi:hypothetical protein
MRKPVVYILSAICTQIMIFLDGLFLPYLRSILKVNPSWLLFILLYILPYLVYLVFGISLALTTVLSIQMQTDKKTAHHSIPLFFIICNLLFLFLYFVGIIPLSSSSSMRLPLLLVGYGISELVCTHFQNK